MSCLIECLNVFKKKEKILIEKDNEIDILKNKIKSLEYKLQNSENNKNKINYDNYNINNNFYRASEDIEEGYTVFE